MRRKPEPTGYSAGEWSLGNLPVVVILLVAEWLICPWKMGWAPRRKLGWPARFMLYGIFTGIALFCVGYSISILLGELDWPRWSVVPFAILTVYSISRMTVNLMELDRLISGEPTLN